ncbi:hypothetical protein FACS1894195_0590 [Bacteroidia bacterium]|nr:hypothetical protein FACS1894195_0590 [Bacteroidia bacterium]
MNKYKNISDQEREELNSNFLISHWSYSGVATFARNQKAFEMEYIYNENRKSSVSAISGTAYHRALEVYFAAKMDGLVLPDVVKLQELASFYILELNANEWKTSKTLPTIEECRQKAIKDSNALIINFLTEISTYDDLIGKIIGVEQTLEDYLTINGVDVPIPCVSIIDLIVTDKNGKTVIIDHKSKFSYTSPDEVAIVSSKQAIVYYNILKESMGLEADRVIFIENKASKNKDGKPQLLVNEIELTKETIRLYEAMLYEPLRAMLQAAQEPDYVYVTNDMDNLVDKVELNNFWIKTLLSEVEDFQIDEKKREKITARLKKTKDAELANITPKTLSNFKKFTEQFISFNYQNSDMTKEEKIEHVLRSFGIVIKVQHILEGYSSDTFLLEVAAGTSISSINRYRLDIANALDIPNVRILPENKVYNGKSYVGIEASKKSEKILKFDAALLSDKKLPIGTSNFGDVLYWDMNNNSTPHALVCGSTGSGKSVCIRSTIEYAKLAGIEVVVFDPKYEFNDVKGIEVYNEISDIETIMSLLVSEMNERVKEGKSKFKMIVFDEFADAVQTSRKGKALDVYNERVEFDEKTRKNKRVKEYIKTDKSLSENLQLLLQKGRSSGYRIISATQRASVDIINGATKVNYPVQICFRVPKAIDSKVVIDEEGAETLNGRGDFLMKSPQYMNVERGQGFYYSEI